MKTLKYWKRVAKAGRCDVPLAGGAGGTWLVLYRGAGGTAVVCGSHYMMEDEFEGDNRQLATITLSDSNFGASRWATILAVANAVSGGDRAFGKP